MEKSVLQIILNHVPEAQMIETGDNGAYKIRLPYCVSEMPRYRELTRALKESPAKPICSTCHSENTKFRYFDNSSSKALQARYKCLACNRLFTLGGKQYCKDQRAASGYDHEAKRKENKFNLEDPDLKRLRLSGSDAETWKPVKFIDYFKQDAQNYVQRQLHTQKQCGSQFTQCPTDHQDHQHSIELQLRICSAPYLDPNAPPDFS